MESTRLCAYAFIDFTCCSPVGIWWSPLDCVLMPLYRLYMPKSSGAQWTPLDCVLCLSIDFTCPSPVESTGLSLKRSPAFRVNCFATQSGGVRWSLPESAGVQLDYVGERKVLIATVTVLFHYHDWTMCAYKVSYSPDQI